MVHFSGSRYQQASCRSACKNTNGVLVRLLVTVLEHAPGSEYDVVETSITMVLCIKRDMKGKEHQTQRGWLTWLDPGGMTVVLTVRVDDKIIFLACHLLYHIFNLQTKLIWVIFAENEPRILSTIKKVPGGDINNKSWNPTQWGTTTVFKRTHGWTQDAEITVPVSCCWTNWTD